MCTHLGDMSDIWPAYFKVYLEKRNVPTPKDVCSVWEKTKQNKTIYPGVLSLKVITEA